MSFCYICPMINATKEVFLTYNKEHKLSVEEKNKVVDFLFNSLEKYGDPKVQIAKAIGYAQGEYPSFGGFVRVVLKGESIVGALVMNRTGMEGYIPSNILVYVAISPSERGNGLGKRLIQSSIDDTTGGVALHVDSENPARSLYERMGFVNKYLEMRHEAQH